MFIGLFIDFSCGIIDEFCFINFVYITFVPYISLLILCSIFCRPE